jgi:hypothetical protein
MVARSEKGPSYPLKFLNSPQSLSETNMSAIKNFGERRGVSPLFPVNGFRLQGSQEHLFQSKFDSFRM